MPKINWKGIIGLILMIQCLSLSAQAQGIGGSLTNSRGGQGMGAEPHAYYIADITVSGVKYADKDLVMLASGLQRGTRIMQLQNDAVISEAIHKLWNNELFSNIEIQVSQVIGDSVNLNIILKERPRLSDYEITGIAKSPQAELKQKFKLVKQRMVTEAMKKDIEDAVFRFYSKKGFYNVKTTITETPDPSQPNAIKMNIHVDKGRKVRINEVSFWGNEHAAESSLKSKMKDSKEMPRMSFHAAETKDVYGKKDGSFKSYLKNKNFLSLSRTFRLLNPYFRLNLFASSKYNPEKYKEDKAKVIEYYNSLGYRDAQIEEDTTYRVKNGHINLALKVDEGQRYYFGDIKWQGNTKYSDSLLTEVLGIKKGQTFNQSLLSDRLNGGPSPAAGAMGPDITTLYMDDGYLFFNITPIETSIVGDTISYLITIQEGPQATNRNITVSGNQKTNDYVLQRELFTMPGEKFSRSDVIRSIRQLSNLGFIDPEHVDPQIQPDYQDGTVDINYHVAEKSSDQLQLSAGFGGGTGFIGSIGILFNNFSMRNFIRFKDWDPLPMGDGQKFSIQFQSNGLWYNSANVSFTEPWLGGRKPKALTVSALYGRYAISDQTFDPNATFLGGFSGDPSKHFMRYWGFGLDLSQRLQWPDNNFVFSYGVNYQNYRLHDFDYFGIDGFTSGSANNLFFKLTLARNSVDQPLYPRSGSNVSFTFQFTPPYSAFTEKDYSQESVSQRYKLVEYHKYRFKAEWYQKIVGNLVFKFAAKYGFLGYYNRDIGYSPFERFQVGGDGMSGFNTFIGRDLISQRGYEVYAPNATIFNKYTMEVRYPFSLNPSATIFGLAFLEAANGWDNFHVYNPFKLYRSGGLGVRIFLPMFGLLGLDYGIGFDNLGPGVKFGSAGRFSFMLGYEPD